MSVINSPPDQPIDQAGLVGAIAFGWRNFFAAVFQICAAQQQAGTTAQRPTAPQFTMYIGRRYFDTTLGIPIWLQSTTPTVWVNSAGAPV